jgi:hypothetical protein
MKSECSSSPNTPVESPSASLRDSVDQHGTPWTSVDKWSTALFIHHCDFC